MSPRPGTLLVDRFRLRSPLGRGGMGELWVAEHLGLGTEVVVKFISAELSARPGIAERFAREAAAAARVNSPHVVTILDYGASPDGAPFIVMEKLEGRDLASCLGERRSLPADEVARIVRQLAKALAKAHASGVVHRDIKPANVFVCDAEGETFVKLLDFGVAKSAAPGAGEGAATASGACVGTPGYMSPEQIVGSKFLDLRADLWSLAVLTFHALTGRKPFAGETPGAVLLAIHSLPHPKPSQLAPELSPAVDAWFERACAREPALRFASAMELSNALSVALTANLDPLVVRAEHASPAHAGPTLSGLVPGQGDSSVALSITPRPRSRAAVLAATIALVAAIGAGAFSAGRLGAAAPVLPGAARSPSADMPPTPPPSNESSSMSPLPGASPLASATGSPTPAASATALRPSRPRPPRAVAPVTRPKNALPPVQDVTVATPTAASVSAPADPPSVFVMPDARR